MSDVFKVLMCSVFGFAWAGVLAQSASVAPLFQEEKPLEIRFTASLEDLKTTKEDSVYFPTILSYKDESGKWDTLHASVRARGKFRRKNCFMPPMRIKINKADRGDKVFAGTKSLKLVLPCSLTKTSGELIMKEYICYQLYEPLTPYVFGTRMVDLTLTDTSSKEPRTYHLKAFFIEDDDDVAKRFESKVVDLENLHPKFMQDTCALRYDLFQYMIGNTDFDLANF